MKYWTISTLFIFLILGFLSNQSTKYLFEANTNKFEPICQLDSYKRAGYYWPLLYLNDTYRDTVGKLNKDIKSLLSSGEISVFFVLDAQSTQIQEVIRTVENMSSVDSVSYITREQALSLYQEFNKDNPLLLEQVSAEILPESLEIHLNSLSDAVNVKNSLKENPIVEEILLQNEFKTDCSEDSK